MKNSEKITAAVALFLAFSFLGIPVPEWLSGFVSSLAGTITAIITGLSKLIAFAQIFIHF